jgi:hypothetical protein
MMVGRESPSSIPVAFDRAWPLTWAGAHHDPNQTLPDRTGIDKNY